MCVHVHGVIEGWEGRKGGDRRSSEGRRDRSKEGGREGEKERVHIVIC